MKDTGWVKRTLTFGTVSLHVNLRSTFHRLGALGHVCVSASVPSLKLVDTATTFFTRWENMCENAVWTEHCMLLGYCWRFRRAFPECVGRRMAGVHRFRPLLLVAGSSKAAFPTKTLLFHSANIWLVTIWFDLRRKSSVVRKGVSFGITWARLEPWFCHSQNRWSDCLLSPSFGFSTGLLMWLLGMNETPQVKQPNA